MEFDSLEHLQNVTLETSTEHKRVLMHVVVTGKDRISRRRVFALSGQQLLELALRAAVLADEHPEIREWPNKPPNLQ